MRLIRCHLPGQWQESQLVELPRAQADHLLKVLRLRVGDRVEIFDGAGASWEAQIAGAGRTAQLQIGRRLPDEPAPRLPVVLLQGLARGDKMDWIVQKATELGVLRIQPLMTEHSVVRIDDRQRARKQEHWRAIAASACEQCGRSRLPSIDAPTTLDLATQESGSESGRSFWMLDPAADEDFAAAAMTLPARQTPAAIALVIGPEGGLSPTEQQLLQVRGARRLRLGSRILRTETAAIAAIAVLQAIAGDLAGK